MSTRNHSPILVLLCSTFLLTYCHAQHMTLYSSDRIVFFGDSITEQGEQPGGYVALLRDTLATTLPGITIVNAGISGNRVPQLQERLDRDVLSQKPTVVVIYIGINDVWHFEKRGTGTSKDQYEAGLRDVVSRIQKTGARVVLCTPSVIGEQHHGNNKFDTVLDEYSRITHGIAKDLGARLCNLRQAFVEYLSAHNPANKEEGILTHDSVHLNDRGNRLVAETVLKSLSE